MLAVGQADSLQVRDEFPGFGVGHGLVPGRPCFHSLEESDFLLRRVGELRLDTARAGCRIVFGLGELIIVIGRDPVKKALHPLRNLIVLSYGRCGAPRSGLDGFHIDADRVGEGSR